MFDWLKESMAGSDNLALGPLTACLLTSLVFGGVVAGIYVLTQRRTRSDLTPFATTLVLLTVLISMVTLVVGNNVARAFSLAGALAIIRFRTVVEDTRDTAFVIFAVVVGMGLGAKSPNGGHDLILIPLVGTPIVAAAALALSYCGPARPRAVVEFALAIRLGLGRDPDSLLKGIFDKYLTQVSLVATITARQGAALDLSYTVRLLKTEAAINFVTELNQIDGVQSVELRQL